MSNQVEYSTNLVSYLTKRSLLTGNPGIPHVTLMASPGLGSTECYEQHFSEKNSKNDSVPSARKVRMGTPIFF